MPLDSLCHVDDLQEKSCKEFSIKVDNDTIELFLVKEENEIYAYQNKCPHTGVTLNWQPDQFLSHDHHFIQCSTHGALFRINDGFCVRGPCNGASLKAITLSNKDGQLFFEHD